MDVSVNTGATSDGLGDNRRVSFAYGSELGERGHVIASVEHQLIDPIEYDPLELGDWFQRYGIVANPAWTTGNTSVPQRLVLPDVYSRNHAPTGKIGTARTAAGATVATFALANQVFTDNGTGVRPFSSVGTILGGTATGNRIRRHRSHQRHDRGRARRPRVQRRALWRRGRAQQRVLRLSMRMGMCSPRTRCCARPRRRGARR